MVSFALEEFVGNPPGQKGAYDSTHNLGSSHDICSGGDWKLLVISQKH